MSEEPDASVTLGYALPRTPLGRGAIETIGHFIQIDIGPEADADAVIQFDASTLENLRAAGIISRGSTQVSLTDMWRRGLAPLASPARSIFVTTVGYADAFSGFGAVRGSAAIWMVDKEDDSFLVSVSTDELAECIIGSLTLPNVLSDDEWVVAIDAQLFAFLSDDPSAEAANRAHLADAAIAAAVATRVANALATRKRTVVMLAVGQSGPKGAYFDELSWFETESGELWLTAFSEDRAVAYVSTVSTFALLEGIRVLCPGSEKDQG